jgi:HAD superfamily hydrolase (TIGR01509 family)
VYKAVFFDMDGVLVDTENFYNRRRSQYLDSIGYEYKGAYDFSGLNDDVIWQAIVPDNIEVRNRLHKGYDQYRKIHPVDYAALANPDLLITLNRLHSRGIKIAVASSSYSNMIKNMIKQTEIGEDIDYSISGSECLCHKPAPEIYQRCMHHLKVLPKESVVVEDSPTGISAGIASGAHVVALSQFVSPRCNQSKADEIIPRLACLTNIFMENNIESIK